MESYFGSAENTDGTNAFCMGINKNETIFYRNSTAGEHFATPVIDKNKIYTLDVYKNNIIFDNTSSTSNMNLINAEQNYTSYIFARNQGKYFSCAHGKIYGCEILDDDKPVRNFVPCYCITTVIDVNGIQCPRRNYWII